MKPQIFTEYYGAHRLRYIVLPNQDLLINAKDVRAVLDLDRSVSSILARPCVDLTGAVWLASEREEDFSEWLIKTFSCYRVTARTMPQCDDDWTNFE